MQRSAADVAAGNIRSCRISQPRGRQNEFSGSRTVAMKPPRFNRFKHEAELFCGQRLARAPNLEPRLRPHETDHCGPSSRNGKARRNTGNSGWEPGSTPGPFHGVSDLFTALSRQGLIADELLLQLATFLRSPDLFLELIVLTSRTLTAKQVRHDGKQDTDNPELSWSGSGACEGLSAHAISSGAETETLCSDCLAAL